MSYTRRLAISDIGENNGKLAYWISDRHACIPGRVRYALGSVQRSLLQFSLIIFLGTRLRVTRTCW